MKKKTIVMLAAIAAAVAAIVVGVLMKMRGGVPASPEEAEQLRYDRTANPEYQKLMEFEKNEQKRTMGEIARARQNLEEAMEANLEPEIIKELQDAVDAGEAELERERTRMRANLRREIWKEQHPEQLKVLEENNAKEREIMAELDAAKKRLDDATAAGASAEELAGLKKNVDSLVARLVDNHNAADAKLRELSSK